MPADRARSKQPTDKAAPGPRRKAAALPRPTFKLENGLDGPVCGIDEAGRGPWAGPVVAAAVILDPACTPRGLMDSKLLSAQKREALARELWRCARVGVGIATVEEIDAINIAQATLLAMRRAVSSLPLAPANALVDGNLMPKLPCPGQTVIKGDAKSRSIAAASIVAKVTRDRMMLELARAFPAYGWEANKGYGAPAHQAGLASHGVTIHHRRSWTPVRALLDEGGTGEVRPPLRGAA